MKPVLTQPSNASGCPARAGSLQVVGRAVDPQDGFTLNPNDCARRRPTVLARRLHEDLKAEGSLARRG
jgi:hypothetical protein